MFRIKAQVTPSLAAKAAILRSLTFPPLPLDDMFQHQFSNRLLVHFLSLSA